MKEIILEENIHRNIIDFIYSIPIQEVDRSDKHNSIAQDFERTTPSKRILNLSEGYDSVILYTGNNTYANKLYKGKVNISFINTTTYCFMHYYAERLKKRICELDYLNKLNDFFLLINHKTINETERAGLEGIINLFILENNLNMEVQLDSLLHLKITKSNTSSNKEANIEIKKSGISNQSLRPYVEYLLKEYGTVRMNIIDFELPIKNVVKLPLKERNLEKEDLIQQLEIELQNQPNEKTKEDIYQRIQEVKQELQKQFDINTIISEGKDVFIQASAGSGKTTLLQWMTYQLALSIDSTQKSSIPVFISLKKYGNAVGKTNFKACIDENLKQLTLEQLVADDTNLILLIDGFDEYKGNINELLNELNIFKKTATSTQLVLSGRAVPAYEHTDMIFETFMLSSFSDTDIMHIATYVLDRKRADKIVSQIIALDLSDQLRVPLFLILFLSYIEELGEKLDDSVVYKLVHNRSELFDKTLIQKFLLRYEKKRAESPIHWEMEKEHQIEAIAYLAYYFTFKLGDVEQANRNEIEIHLQNYLEQEVDINEIRSVIDSFIHFNILKNDFSEVGFEKKEFRYFFAAKYLSKRIVSKKDFIKLKDDFLSIDKVDIVQSWLSFKSYLFGLIEPNNFIKGFEKYLHKGSFLLTRKSAWILYFALEFVDKKRYPQKPYHYINEAFLAFILKKLIHDFSISENRKRPAGDILVMILPIYFLEFSANKFNRLISLFPAKFIDKTNCAYLTQYLKLPLSDFSRLIEAFSMFRLNNSFWNIQNVLAETDEFYRQETNDLILFGRFKKFYDNWMNAKAYLPRITNRFSRLEKLEIAYNLIINYPVPTSVTNNGLFSRELLRSSIKETISNDTNSFINYFLKRHPSPNFYLVFRIYWFITHSGLSLFKPNISSLDHKTQKILSKIFLSALTDFKKVHSNFRLSVLMILKGLHSGFVDELMDECVSLITTDNQERYKKIHAVGTILSVSRPKSIDMLSAILTNTYKIDQTIEERDQLCFLILNAINTEFIFFKYMSGTSQINNALGLFTDYLYSKSPNTFLVKEILLYTRYSNDTLEEFALQLFENYLDNESLVSATISFFGKFKIKKAIPKLEALLPNSFESVRRKIYYNLTLIESSQYQKHFTKFEDEYYFFKQSLQNRIESKKSIEEKTLLKTYLCLGDEEFLILYETLLKNDLIKGEAGQVSKYYHNELKKKVAVLQFIEKTS